MMRRSASDVGRGPVFVTAGCVLLVLLLCSADVYLDREGLLPLPSSMASLAVVVALLSMTPWVEGAAVSGWREAWPGMAWLLAPLLVLSLLTLLGMWRPEAYAGEGSKHFFLIVYSTFVFAAALLLGTTAWLRRRWRAIARGALIVTVSTIIWDLVAPGSFSDQLARGAGLAVNANVAALHTLIALVIALRYDRLRAVDLVIMVIGVLGVFATLSRGGIVMLGFLLLVHLGRTVVMPLVRGQRGAARSALLVGAVVALVGGTLAGLVSTAPMFEDLSARRRVGILTGETSFVDPQEGRVSLVREYVGRIAEAPLLGHGPGYVHAQPRGPHNVFLRFWVELGVVGVIAYVAWLAAMLQLAVIRRSVAGLVLVLLLVLQSLVDHNLVEQRVVILAAGIEMGRLLLQQGGPTWQELTP